jgi:hypothetical protein
VAVEFIDSIDKQKRSGKVQIAAAAKERFTYLING